VDINELGQLFITGFNGPSLGKDAENFIKESNIGGVIFFQHNFSDPAQLAELVNQIQVLRDEYPLFISVDQEGGRVRRFKEGFTQFPPMLTIGEKGSPKLTYEVHRAMAEELACCGINLNFAPCSDVFTNPANKVIGDRAFGKTAEEVEKHVSAAIRGLHTENVLACAKHFPGHGDTLKDSHFDLPYVTKALDNLKQNELIPFAKASKSRVEFIMMAHLVVDAIDPSLPCTLSQKAYQFLREYIKYNKIIITDDMEMKAIADKYSTEEAAIMALEAGADIIMYRSLAETQKAYSAVKDAVKTQRLKKSVIDEKLNRIKSCKKRFLSNYQPIYIPSIEKKIRPSKNKDLLAKFLPAEQRDCIPTQIVED
jgi:beta-N-acetylhexosaminidase